MKNIKLAVIDDHTLFREGISELLGKQKGIKVVMKAGNGLEAVSKLNAKKSRPDVILMDVQMPVMNGVEATKAIISKFRGIKIIALTMHDNDQMIYHLIESGASGFLAKDAHIDVVVEAITSVHEKGHYLDERTSAAMMKNTFRNNRISPAIHRLTEKEISIVKLICSEHTVKEIGEIMKLSHRTIEALKLKIQEKVGAKNTVGLVLYALRNNLLFSKL